MCPHIRSYTAVCWMPVVVAVYYKWSRSTSVRLCSQFCSMGRSRGPSTHIRLETSYQPWEPTSSFSRVSLFMLSCICESCRTTKSYRIVWASAKVRDLRCTTAVWWAEGGMYGKGCMFLLLDTYHPYIGGVLLVNFCGSLIVAACRFLCTLKRLWPLLFSPGA